MTTEEIQILIRTEVDKAVADLKKVDQAATSTEEKAKDLSSTFKTAGSGSEVFGKALSGLTGMLGGAIAGFASIQTAVRLVGASLNEYADSAQNQARLAAQIRATGQAAGFTAGQLKDMADRFQGSLQIEDDEIMGAQSALLKFTGITGKAFEDATRLSLDLSRTMGTDAASAAQILGKALEEPAEGLSMLRRAGVNLSTSQEDLVKKLAASGDAAGAQALILKEVEGRVGGVAEAIAGVDATGMKDLTLAMKDLAEETGRALSQYIKPFASAIAGIFRDAAENRKHFNDIADAEKGSIDPSKLEAAIKFKQSLRDAAALNPLYKNSKVAFDNIDAELEDLRERLKFAQMVSSPSRTAAPAITPDENARMRAEFSRITGVEVAEGGSTVTAAKQFVAATLEELGKAAAREKLKGGTGQNALVAARDKIADTMSSLYESGIFSPGGASTGPMADALGNLNVRIAEPERLAKAKAEAEAKAKKEKQEAEALAEKQKREAESLAEKQKRELVNAAEAKGQRLQDLYGQTPEGIEESKDATLAWVEAQLEAARASGAAAEDIAKLEAVMKNLKNKTDTTKLSMHDLGLSIGKTAKDAGLDALGQSFSAMGEAMAMGDDAGAAAVTAIQNVAAAAAKSIGTNLIAAAATVLVQGGLAALPLAIGLAALGGFSLFAGGALGAGGRKDPIDAEIELRNEKLRQLEAAFDLEKDVLRDQWERNLITTDQYIAAVKDANARNDAARAAAMEGPSTGTGSSSDTSRKRRSRPHRNGDGEVDVNDFEDDEPLSGTTTTAAGDSDRPGRSRRDRESVDAAAGGADFVTAGPKLLLVGDNPGGRERVRVEPISSPNLYGPRGDGGTTIVIQGPVFGVDDLYGRLEAAGERLGRRGKTSSRVFE